MWCFWASTKIQTQSIFTSNRTDKDIVPDVTLQYDCCEHLGSKLKLNIVKGTSELPLKNLHTHSSAFKYADHSIDKEERLILQNEAKLRRENNLNQLNFLSYIGIAMTLAILLLLCCCVCTKCNCWKRWMDDECCGRICIRETVTNQRDVKSSNEDLRERIQIFDQQNRSPSLQSFPASTSLEMTTVDSTIYTYVSVFYILLCIMWKTLAPVLAKVPTLGRDMSWRRTSLTALQCSFPQTFLKSFQGSKPH
jgi:hypothetical protein